MDMQYRQHCVPPTTASPFLCIAADPQRELMALGTADGKVGLWSLALTVLA